MSEITMIKKDASVNITMGTGFILKIQQMLPHLIENVTSEQIAEYKKLLEEGVEDFPEPWMEHVKTLTILISTIEIEAVKQGATYKENIDTPTPQGD
jgi:hypothetical protein